MIEDVSRRERRKAAWAVTRKYLDGAIAIVERHAGAMESEELTIAREYLEHNELGLALDVLEDLGECLPSLGHEYWAALSKAAESMELGDRAQALASRAAR